MNKDQYGEIVNGEETYQTIADALSGTGSIIFGWTDEDGIHFDILMTRFPIIEGTIQGGIGANYLYVSIMRMGAWGFKVDLDGSVTDNYVKEKLGVNGDSEAKALAELINGVKSKIRI